MRRLLVAFLGIATFALVSPDQPANADGHLSEQGPNPFSDFTKLSGTWVLAIETQLSTCTADPSGAKSTFVWTISYANGRVNAKSSSGAEFTGALVGKDLAFMPLVRPRSNLFSLRIQNAKTLTGTGMYALEVKDKKDPICIVYRSITATKQ